MTKLVMTKLVERLLEMGDHYDGLKEILKVGGADGEDGVEWLKRFLGSDYTVEYRMSDTMPVVGVSYRGENRFRKRYHTVALKQSRNGEDVIASPVGSTSKVFPPSIARMWKIAGWIRSDGKQYAPIQST